MLGKLTRGGFDLGVNLLTIGHRNMRIGIIARSRHRLRSRNAFASGSFGGLGNFRGLRSPTGSGPGADPGFAGSSPSGSSLVNPGFDRQPRAILPGHRYALAF